jgi:hypothetical protein
MKSSRDTECPSTGLRRCIVDCAGVTLYRYKQCTEKDNQLQQSVLLMPGVPVALPKSDALDFSTLVFALIVIPVFISNLLRDRTTGCGQGIFLHKYRASTRRRASAMLSRIGP